MAHRDRTRNGTQIAALPIRWDRRGTLYVLMTAVHGSRRWVMPGGWRMDADKPWKTAETEALNEAGAVGHVGPNPIGRYSFGTRTADGEWVLSEVEVFPMVVERLRRDWKDRRLRKRRWFEAGQAAHEVEDEALAELLRSLSMKPVKRTAIGRLFSGIF